MKRCIFCGKSETEFDSKNCWTEEHIIPHSLGNETLKICNVCKKCNSGLGTYIDSYFVNHMIVKIIRQGLGLKSQSGEIPNAFKEGKDENGHRIRVDENFHLTTVPYYEQDGNRLRIVAPNEEEAKKIIKTKLLRMGFGEKDIQNALSMVEKTEIHSVCPEIRYDFTIEFNRFFAEALKIAYEYAIYKLGEAYLVDPRAQEIQQYLKSAIDGNMKKECIQPNGVNRLPDCLGEIIKKVSGINCHLLIIHRDAENKLVCDVILFMDPMLSYAVLLSDDASNYNISYEQDIVDINTKPDLYTETI